MTRRTMLRPVAGALLALAACSGGTDSTDTAAPTSSQGVETTPTPTAPGSSDAAAEPSATDVTTSPVTEPPVTEPPVTEPPVTEPPVTSPLDGVAALAVIEVTPGERPRFTWEAVDTAASYSVLVTDEDGRAIWAWRGTTTSIDLGAGLIEGNEGPRVRPGSTLDVFALARDGEILAASGPVPVSP